MNNKILFFVLILFSVWISCRIHDKEKDKLYKKNIQANDYDSTIIALYYIDSLTAVKYTKQSVSGQMMVWNAYKMTRPNIEWDIEFSDTIGFGSIFRDTVFDCDGDGLPNLVIANCSTTGSFGGCNYIVVGYSSKTKKNEMFTSIVNKNSISFFPIQGYISTYDLSYTYEVVKLYKWYAFDSLVMFRLDSIVSPFAEKEQTRYIKILENDKVIERQSSNGKINEKYKNYFGK